MNDHEHVINDVSQLEEIIGEPMDFLRAKVVSALDDSMLEFVQR